METHLGCLQPDRQPIIHHGFQLLVVLVSIALLPFRIDLLYSLLIRELALDCDMARIYDEMSTIIGSDTIELSRSIKVKYTMNENAYSSGIMMMGALRSI